MVPSLLTPWVWHRLFTQHRNSTAAPAEVDDPLAAVREASLASAQAAALAAREKRLAKGHHLISAKNA